MKKAISLISAVFFILFLFGCAKKEPEIAFDDGFSFNTGIKYNDTSFSAIVKLDGDGVCLLEFTDPAPLSGMKMKYENNEISVEYLGLKWEGLTGAFPDSAVGEAVAVTIESLTKPKGIKYTASDEHIVMKGGTGDEKFEIYLDKKTKEPVYAKIPEAGIEFSIENFQQTAGEVVSN